MKKFLLLILFTMFLLNVSSVNAANLVCGTGSIGTCPTVGTACSGVGATCDYKNCTCVVTASQTIDSNANYYFANLTINSGVTVTVSTQAAGGTGGSSAAGNPGSNGPGLAAGASGGKGGDFAQCPGGTGGGAGGSYAGGGGGGCGYNRAGGAGGSYEGGGAGGGGYYTGGVGGTGGAGGGRININANVIKISGSIVANGAIGSNSGYAGGGGGGGGGGNIILNGNFISISGSLTANGANGGTGDSPNGGCGGGGGGGGYIQIRYACTYSAGSYSVAGGTGGSGYSAGAAGGTGSTSAAKIDQPYSYNQALNITLKNQGNAAISSAYVYYYEAGTSTVVCNGLTDADGFYGLGFGEPGRDKIYDVNVTTALNYQQNIWYKAARIPGNVSMDGNRKWIPETTLAASKLFTAGHIVPVEIHLFAPWTTYEVANISLEDTVPTGAKIASNILFEKFNSTGTYKCDVLSDNSTYYFVDKTECSFLSYLNVTAKEWLRVTYRTRIEGPEAYTSIGQQKTYTLPYAYLRFDVVT